MRAPQDMPRPGSGRPRRGAQAGRGRVVLIVVAVVVVVGLLSLRLIAGIWTDYLWFDSLDQSGVFTGVVRAKATLIVMFTGSFFLLLWVNLWVADRVAPAFRAVGPEEELAARYRELVGGRTNLVRTVTAALFALITGAEHEQPVERVAPVPQLRRLRRLERPALQPRRQLLRLQAAVPDLRRRVAVRRPRDRADHHGRRPLPERRHPAAGAGTQPRHATGEGAPVGAARAPRPREGGRLLAPAVRADGVDPRAPSTARPTPTSMRSCPPSSS